MASSPAGPLRTQLLSSEIDQLFEHYLNLLHQYDALRSSLSSLQASIQQNIARANFDAQRGVRYGQDCYDQRMQAARRCCVTRDPEGAALFAVGAVGEGEIRSAASESVHEENAEERKSGIPADGDGVKGEVDADETKEGEKPEEEAKKGANRPKDPIRMFGILTPQALRLAQGGAIKMVEDVVPKLVSIDAEMKEVEIKIRRARKQRAKAEALEETTVGERREEGIAA